MAVSETYSTDATPKEDFADLISLESDGYKTAATSFATSSVAANVVPITSSPGFSSGTQSLSFDGPEEGDQNPIFKTALDSLAAVAKNSHGRGPKQSKEARDAIVKHEFLNRIERNLQTLSTTAQSPSCSLSAIELLVDLKEFIRMIPTDPIAVFIAGLFEGLSVNDRWADYTEEQYNEVTKILLRLTKHQPNSGRIDKALNDLDNIGIDPDPFEIPNF